MDVIISVGLQISVGDFGWFSPCVRVQQVHSSHTFHATHMQLYLVTFQEFHLWLSLRGAIETIF